ncbi:MAG: hypothetical protein OXT03_01060 [Alphaproteobacteria bacterium]|nr:hypothetical protein [Alphaproteobacteria bacterium]
MTDNEKEFEEILDKAVDNLKTAVKLAPSMDSFEFEDSTFKAIQEAAKGTGFERKIKKTSKGAFPDIICKPYGVEVKQVLKNKPITRGNSIFESSRVQGVQKVYLVMFWHARKAETANIIWRRYQDIINGIAITHSPRYSLDAELSDEENLFEQIGISYDKFRLLSQDEMMKQVRELYRKRGQDKNLWWLETQDREPLRFLKSASDTERSCLIGETFFLCPQIFGKNQQKFDAVVAYWLSRGFVCHALRDEFSSGGKKTLDNVKVQRIIYHAVCTQRDDIIRAAKTLESDVIQQFWELESDDKVPPPNKRIQEWLCLVRKHYKGEPEALEVLERAFNNS